MAELIAGVEGAITLSEGKGPDELTIDAAGFKGSVKGIPVTDYPPVPDVSAGGGITLGADALFQLLGVSAFTEQSNDGKTTETVCLTWRQKDGKDYTAIAKGADGSVICTTNTKAKQRGRASGNVEVLIPQAAIASLRPLIRNISGDVRLAQSKSKSHLVLEAEGLKAWISLQPGKYFDIKPMFAPVFECPHCQTANRAVDDTVQCTSCKKDVVVANASVINPIMGTIDMGKFQMIVKKAIMHIGPRGKDAGKSLNALLSVRKKAIHVQYKSGASIPSTFDLPFTIDNKTASVDIGFNLRVLEKLLSGLGNQVGSNATVMVALTAPNMPMVMKVATTAGPIVAMAMPVALELAK